MAVKIRGTNGLRHYSPVVPLDPNDDQGPPACCWRPSSSWYLRQFSFEPDRDDELPYFIESLSDPVDAFIPDELLDPLRPN